MTIQSLSIEKRSATTTTPPGAQSAVEQIGQLIDISKCIGCKGCTVACFEWNDLRAEIGNDVGNYDERYADLSDQMWSIMRFREVDGPDGQVQWFMRKDSCLHCADPGCIKACPAPGAIVKYANGVVDFNQANCIGCGYCVSGCPFNIPRVSKKDNKAYKCNMCVDRLQVGQYPICVKTCPSSAISFGSHKDMIAKGEKRATQLQARGFQHAALYNPQGVGGTHVMYVVPRGDQLEHYGLPKDPHISPWVNLWRGFTKPLLALGLGLGVLTMFFHYVTKGPVEEDAGDDHGKVDAKEGGRQ